MLFVAECNCSLMIDAVLLTRFLVNFCLQGLMLLKIRQARAPQRSSYKCTAGQTTIHQGLVTSVVETRLTEDGPQMTIEALRQPDPEPDRPTDQLPRRPPELGYQKPAALQQRQDNPPPKHQHMLQETTTGYAVDAGWPY